MREIKFRAWHERLKRMIDLEGAYLTSVGFDWTDEKGKSWEIESDTVMQFTGLKDKNGKEIYEGDIVSWGGSMYGFGKVVYERYSFLVKYKLGEVEDEMYFNHPDAYTIIGNIYETPELLTTPK